MDDGGWQLVTHRDGIEVRFGGSVGARTLRAANDAAYEATPADRPAFILFDLSAAKELTISLGDVAGLAALDTKVVARFPHLVQVIIATLPHHFGIARQWQLHAEAVPSLVVSQRMEAVTWLAARGLLVE